MRIDRLLSTLDVIVLVDEQLADAASRMRFNDVACVPVFDRGHLVGILTERDLTRAIADGIDPSAAVVADYMTPDPVVITPRTTVDEAAELMITAGVRHLLVVDRGTLRGVLSMRDLVVDRLAIRKAS